MTSRADVVALALADNGYNDGKGYGVASKYSAGEGHGAEYDCADGVSFWFREAGLPLPIMQPGDKDGFSYCPDAYNYAKQHNAIIPSWKAQPGDFVLYDWNGDGVADHVELVELWHDGHLDTIGADSGPSNYPGDTHHGNGGTHRHRGDCPAGKGNDYILAAVDASKLPGIKFGKSNPAVKKATPAPVKAKPEPRLLQLVTPHMTGADVKDVQHQLNVHKGYHLAEDGDYGPATEHSVRLFQQATHLQVDGKVGPATRKSLGL